MAEGTKTFHGLAVPLFGESEIQQQTAATDILTLTGASGMSGDFLVLQNSTGGELASFGASSVTLTNYPLNLAINSTTATNYGIKLTMGASAVGEAGIEYSAGITGNVTGLLGISSSNGPTYFLRVGTSAGMGVGAAAANGFFTPAPFYYVSAPSTAIPMGAIKMQAGSKAYYIPCIPDTGMAAS